MVGIIHYNMGNIASVKHAFDFLNIPAQILKSADELKNVSHIVLPGVGAFSQGMHNLREAGWEAALQSEVQENKKPFLGICLGMQLLASSGVEGGETPGLGLIKGRVIRLPAAGVRLPHVGWNNVTIVKPNPLITVPADFYFVHSYFIGELEESDLVATCEYGQNFPAIVHKGNVYGTQFHPEKSHAAGLQILKNFAAL
jgi:glutamine amidotransferase